MLSTSVSTIDRALDPLSTFVHLREMFPGDCFLLESVEGTKRTARHSFIGVDPLSTFSAKDGTVDIDGNRFSSDRPFHDLERHFRSFRCGTMDGSPFSGGMVGHIGYDAVCEFEHVPRVDGDNSFPDIRFMVPRHLVCIDHLESRTHLVSHGDIADLKTACGSIEAHDTGPVHVGDAVEVTSRGAFEAMVRDAKAHISDGDVFQVVPSRALDVEIEGDPMRIYETLRSLNPSPYLFYLDLGDLRLIGSSPEMLVRLEGRTLTTRPLAGTRPRGSDVEEDERLKLDMLLDEKERAEHLMLVDLHRNDMGRVSEIGSVKVTELMGVERFSHVQHIVSNIESELRHDLTAFDALRSCFPAGTVTGAPKIRAMELISELESVPRGPYAGAVGRFGFDGDMDFGIVIRSIMMDGTRARLQAGAGIVHDSVPEREFEETGHKMGALLDALRGSSS